MGSRDGGMTKRAVSRAVAFASSGALLLSGCASLPSSGPTARQIVRGAEADRNLMGFRIVDVAPANIAGLGVEPTLPAMATTAAVSTTALAGLARPGRVDVIGPGDVLQISVFEVGASLFSGGGQATLSESGALPQTDTARRGQVTGLSVDEDGAISVPYVGRLQVAGKTTTQVGRMIEAGLAGKSQSPQVIVTLGQTVASTVLVTGQARTPGRYRLTGARETLLDAIADAGGIAGGSSTGGADQPEDIRVRFTRDGRTVEAPLSAIRSRSADDLVLLPRDRIELLRRERSYVVLGAAGRVAQAPFNAVGVSLAEAVARAGGPSDTSADPRAVFVFRYAPAQGGGGPDGTPIIYRLDLTDPASYFLSQRFAMQDKDVVYLANSPSNTTSKLVQIINLLISPIFSVTATALALKNN